MKYVSAHLHERIRCEDVAAACGVSADYLSSAFKKTSEKVFQGTL